MSDFNKDKQENKKEQEKDNKKDDFRRKIEEEFKKIEEDLKQNFPYSSLISLESHSEEMIDYGIIDDFFNNKIKIITFPTPYNSNSEWLECYDAKGNTIDNRIIKKISDSQFIDYIVNHKKSYEISNSCKSLEDAILYLGEFFYDEIIKLVQEDKQKILNPNFNPKPTTGYHVLKFSYVPNNLDFIQSEIKTYYKGLITEPRLDENLAKNIFLVLENQLQEPLLAHDFSKDGKHYSRKLNIYEVPDKAVDIVKKSHPIIINPHWEY